MSVNAQRNYRERYLYRINFELIFKNAANRVEQNVSGGNLRIAIRRVWQKMEALGLPHTKVHSKVFLRLASVATDSSAKYGLGVTTPNEMARLFEMMANGGFKSTHDFLRQLAADT